MRKKRQLLSCLCLLFLCACTGQEMSPTPTPVPTVQETEPPGGGTGEERLEEAREKEFTLCFAGDINLDENWGTTHHMDRQEDGILDCIDETLVGCMRSADLMCLNNEFTYSDRGSPLPGKTYTFRADPERVTVLDALGVDLVSLANNHIYDYGKTAFLDTLETLEGAEIGFFGAGRTLDEAKAPFYVEVEGVTVAFVGASRAEKNRMTPQATQTEPGILLSYDTALVLESIREAREKADLVLVFVHWGTEYSTVLEEVQVNDGRAFIDAGADAVIGAHPHCLQGMEYYNGRPVFYSLGNYWFNEKTLDSMLLKLTVREVEGEVTLTPTILPALQKGYTTSYVSDVSERRALFDRLESLSSNVTIADDGTVTEWRAAGAAQG